MQFDLKGADIFITDGHSNTGAVNNSGGYAIGTTSLAVDNIVGAIPDGVTVTINGEDYTITAASETLGNTTSITISPGLIGPVADNAALVFSDENNGAINNGAGYAGGHSSAKTVDGVVGIIKTGSKVIFEGHATEYTVTAHSETLGNTTSITLTPALTSAVVDDEEFSVVYANTGLVNHAGGYSTSSTTMAVDGITGIIPAGVQLNITGDSQAYTVTSVTNFSGNTTGITFTPGLQQDVADDVVLNFGPNRMQVVIGEGNLTYDEKRPIQYMKDRGKLDTTRLGDEEPIDVRLDLRWEFLSTPIGATTPTIEEALKQIGPAASWVSSSADPCEPFAVNLEIHYTPLCSDVEKELIVLPDYRYESLAHDAKAGTISTSGKCNATQATRTRVDAF